MAVLIDAFIVRTALVPALMALLGRRTWWSPAPLRRLHDRVAISETPPPQPPTHKPAAVPEAA
jgi:RND superfamily putative drug exporter